MENSVRGMDGVCAYGSEMGSKPRTGIHRQNGNAGYGLGWIVNVCQ
jgi:hypothetical protein